MTRKPRTGMHRGARGSAPRPALFAQICAGTRAALEAMCRVRRPRAGKTVVEEAETTDFVGCVLSGILHMQKTLADGRQHIVGLLVEGDLFGRIFDGPAEFAIEATTDAEFCAFPRAAFETLLARSPDLDRAVLINITNELDRTRDWMIILSNRKVASRLAGFLLLLCARFRNVDHILRPGPDGIEVRIPIGRTDLAHLLGTRPESISRALHALGDQGMIDILEPDRILIRDAEGLARAADEEESENVALKELSRTRRLRQR